MSVSAGGNSANINSVCTIYKTNYLYGKNTLREETPRRNTEGRESNYLKKANRVLFMLTSNILNSKKEYYVI
jgi:hypothetical protein